MKKIKIAQIGVGHDHACNIFDTLRHLTDLFEVVGYARVPEDDLPYEWAQKNRVKPSREYDGAKEYTVEEILAMPDLDAVAIETYDLNLVKYAQMAADRGLHIHMDKAPGEDVEAFEKLLSTVKEKKLAFNIGYMYRFNPAIREAFEKIKNGEIGKVHSIDAEMDCYYPADKREWLSGFQSGMMQYLGCHLVDLVVRLQGVPEKIIPHNMDSYADDVQAIDMGFAVFEYNYAMATIRSSMMDVGGYARRHLVVNGEKGSISICPLERAEPQVNGCIYSISATTNHYTLNAPWGDGEKKDTEVFDRYQTMMKEFAKMVRGERGLEVDLETEARVERCLLAAGGIDCDYKGEIKL
jgi:predicted dehydrogenase